MRRGLISVAIFVAFVAIFTLSRHLTSSTTTTTTSTSTTTSSTTSTLASTACDASQFSGVYNEGEGAAGTIEASITLTKSGGVSCVLKGWPLLTLQDRLGAVLVSRTVDEPSAANSFQFLNTQANAAPKALTLTSGDSVNFALAYSDVPAGTSVCPSAVTVSVQFISGGASVPVTPQYALQPCNGGEIWVSPFY